MEPTMDPYINDSEWLNIMHQDALREGLETQALGDFTLGGGARAMIWVICKWFHCRNMGVEGQTVRIFERYIAGVVRPGLQGNSPESVWPYLKDRLTLYVACSFQLAAKTLKSFAPVSPKRIHLYLVTTGQKYTLKDVILTEREIFKTIGYHVPLFSSLEMAELLAVQMEIDSSSLEVVRQIISLAELRRQDIELEVRWVAGTHRMPDGQPRVRTFHLAAGCVAAAVKKIQPSKYKQAIIRLTSMLQVSRTYVQILSEITTLWITNNPREPVSERRRRPNILKKNPDTNGPQPGSSKEFSENNMMY